MKNSWLKIALLVLLCAALGFELWHFRNGSALTQLTSGSASRKNVPDFSLLPATQIEEWEKYFAPGSRAESWEPTLGDMNDVEAELAQITVLSKTEPDPSRRIQNPQGYYRQYLGVQINGKNMLFLNAICSVDHYPNWRKHLVVVRDGGKCYWHATYDLSIRSFNDLSINGRG